MEMKRKLYSFMRGIKMPVRRGENYLSSKIDNAITLIYGEN